MFPNIWPPSYPNLYISSLTELKVGVKYLAISLSPNPTTETLSGIFILRFFKPSYAPIAILSEAQKTPSILLSIKLSIAYNPS